MICRYCDEGRHVRCTKGDCECATCAVRAAGSWAPTLAVVKEKKGPKEPKEPKVRTPRPKAPPKPKKPLVRSVAIETVIHAAALKQTGKSWSWLGEHFGVPAERLRYAVNHYDYPKPEPVDVTGTVQGLQELVQVREEQQQLIHAATTLLASVQALLPMLEEGAEQLAAVLQTLGLPAQRPDNSGSELALLP